MATKSLPAAAPGKFKNGSDFVEPDVYASGDRDGLSKAEYVAARKLSPIPRPARRCAVCNHPERARIEALHVAGVSLEQLGEQFDLHRDAIWRHCKSHMSEEVKASYLLGPSAIAELAKQASVEGRSVLDYLSIVRSILTNALVNEAAAGKSYAVERIAGRLIDVLQAIGAQTGEVQRLAGTVFNLSQTNVQMINSPEFTQLQAGLLEVCQQFPEARGAIVALFQRLDAQHAPQAVPGGKLIEGKALEAAE